MFPVTTVLYVIGFRWTISLVFMIRSSSFPKKAEWSVAAGMFLVFSFLVNRDYCGLFHRAGMVPDFQDLFKRARMSFLAEGPR